MKKIFIFLLLNLIFLLTSCSFFYGISTDGDNIEEKSGEIFLSEDGTLTWTYIYRGNTDYKWSYYLLKSYKSNYSSGWIEENKHKLTVEYVEDLSLYGCSEPKMGFEVKLDSVDVIKQDGKYIFLEDATKYTVSFDTNGINPIESQTSYYIDYLPRPNLDIDLGANGKDAYEYTGWYLDKNYTIPITTDYFIPSKDTTIYIDVKRVQCTVKLIAQLGDNWTYEKIDISTVTVNKWDTIDLSTITAPDIQGYTFRFWSPHDTLIKQIEEKTITSDCKIYAIYEKN